MQLWKSDEINDIFATNLPDLLIKRVSIDSRTTEAGDLFVAIKGQNYDGNQYVKDALEKGAVCAISSDIRPLRKLATDEKFVGDWERKTTVYSNVHEDLSTELTHKLPSVVEFPKRSIENAKLGGNIIVVDDTLEALRKLAVYSRKRCTGKIVAITGSVGKTTTKEMCRHVLQNFGKIYASTGNFNNHFGLPLCLANMPSDVDFAVLELGMSAKGEILDLSTLCSPHIAAVTAIAPAHLEFFSSVQEIAEAKGEIFAGVVKNGFAVINNDTQYSSILKQLAKDLGISTCGQGAAFDVIKSSVSKEHTDVCLKYKDKQIDYKIGILGHQHAKNSAIVMAIADLLSIDVEKASFFLRDFKASKGRGEVKKAGGITIIDESYNASPEAVKSAIITLSEIQGGRKIAILADMKELGVESIKMHIELANVLISSNIDKVFAVGECMKHMFDTLPDHMQGTYALSWKEMNLSLKGELQDGDVVMVKGSRSMSMDKVVEWIQMHY